MRTHQQRVHDYEDAYLGLIADRVIEQEGMRLEQFNQELLNDPTTATSAEMDQRSLRTISACFAKEREHAQLRRTAHILRLTAAIVILSVLIFTAVYALSEDFRARGKKILVGVTDRYTEIRFGDDLQTEGAPVGRYFEHLSVGWVPEDFIVAVQRYDQFVMYQNRTGNGETIYISYGNEDVEQMQYEDLEGAEISDFEILGRPALTIRKNDSVWIRIKDEARQCSYLVLTTDGVDFETAEKVAENLIIE